MTKKYTPPGGWAAQRQRQILWFLLMFLFFGGMGWFLHVQVGEIMRIERDTERMRRRRELEALRDREARERQIRREALFGNGGIPPPDDVFQRDRERADGLAETMLRIRRHRQQRERARALHPEIYRERERRAAALAAFGPPPQEPPPPLPDAFGAPVPDWRPAEGADPVADLAQERTQALVEALMEQQRRIRQQRLLNPIAVRENPELRPWRIQADLENVSRPWS